MVSIKLYVEGGGDSKVLKTACRRGFRMFIEKTGVAGSMPSIVACGSRENAYDRFKTAVAREDGLPMLLVDAEGPVSASGPWQLLKQRDGWDRPNDAADSQCHLMVQVMESWFLADRGTLEKFYGERFRWQALPSNPNVEQVPKQDVLDGLDQAARNTKKGSYKKGAHSYEILEMLDPAKVRKASPYADRFIKALSSQ